MSRRSQLAKVACVLAALLSGPPAEAAPPTAKNVLLLVEAGEPGTRLIVQGTVVEASGHPLPGAQLHVYQTDATGSYTRERAMDEPHARLAGFLRTDAQGRFEIHTIRPGGYPKALRLGDRERKIPAVLQITLEQ